MLPSRDGAPSATAERIPNLRGSHSFGALTPRRQRLACVGLLLIEVGNLGVSAYAMSSRTQRGTGCVPGQLIRARPEAFSRVA